MDAGEHHVHYGNRHQHLQVTLKVDGIQTEQYAYVNGKYGSFSGPEVTPGSYREYKFAKPVSNFLPHDRLTLTRFPACVHHPEATLTGRRRQTRRGRYSRFSDRDHRGLLCPSSLQKSQGQEGSFEADGAGRCGV